MTASTPPTIRYTLADQAAPPHAALLLIDMVNDLVDPAGKAAVRAGRPIAHARAAIAPQRRLLAAARAAGVRVVYVNHTTLPDRAGASGPWLAARSRATYSVEDLCLVGSWGAQVVEELAPRPGDLVVGKYRYSGFAGTNLDLVLRSAGVETVVCAGVSTNACVEATAREAFSLDYYVVFARDACASWDPSLHEATLATAAHRYATVATVDELAAVWPARSVPAAAAAEVSR
jgi:nicotinamidase-related amidase